MTKNKNILVQEEEFLKLNEEIGRKTESLLNEMDQIKKMQLKNDILYSDLNVSTVTKKKHGSVNETQREAYNSGSEKFSEDNIVIKEYCPLKNQSSSLLKVEDFNEEQREKKMKKDNVRRNPRLINSAKVTASLINAQGRKSLLSLGVPKFKSDMKLKQGKLEDEVIPNTLKELSNDVIVKFLSAKVKLLTTQLEAVQKEEKKHLEKIRELQTIKNKSVDERDKLLQQANTSKNFLVRYEKHVENMSGQMQCALTENGLLKKELEALKKEMINTSKNHSTNETKLNKTLEEVEKLRMVIQQLKQEEKEFKEQQKKKTEDLKSTIRNLDKQRAELLNGFKKQLVLIDNLKRQKGLIEVGKFLTSAEDDFASFLDCNSPNISSREDSVKSINT